MQREIGSNFWLNPKEQYKVDSLNDLTPYGIYGSDVALLSTGRMAERFVLETIQKRNSAIKKIALVPPYTCETVINPFLQLGYELYTYPIDIQLNTTPEKLEEVIYNINPTVVLFHRYFGFETWNGCDEVIQRARKRGIIFIEDKTQCLYSDLKKIEVDYIIGSMRKWAGLPDGGFAVCLEGKFEQKAEQYHQELEEAKVRASYLKYNYLFHQQGEKTTFLAAYRLAENILSNQTIYYRMSSFSEKVQASMDVEQLKKKRRENYKVLFQNLTEENNIYPLTPELTDGVVPLYYAALVKDRGLLQEKLRKEDIYAPIVWPLFDRMPETCFAAESIYKEVLCFPIDQRYEEDDMLRIVECIKKSGGN